MFLIWFLRRRTLVNIVSSIFTSVCNNVIYTLYIVLVAYKFLKLCINVPFWAMFCLDEMCFFKSNVKSTLCIFFAKIHLVDQKMLEDISLQKYFSFFPPKIQLIESVFSKKICIGYAKKLTSLSWNRTHQTEKKNPPLYMNHFGNHGILMNVSWVFPLICRSVMHWNTCSWSELRIEATAFVRPKNPIWLCPQQDNKTERLFSLSVSKHMQDSLWANISRILYELTLAGFSVSCHLQDSHELTFARFSVS